MSKIQTNINYVKMAQYVAFIRFLARRLRSSENLNAKQQRFVDELEWTADKITSTLDDGMDAETLKRIKEGDHE